MNRSVVDSIADVYTGQREALIADNDLQGRAFCQALSTCTDAMLTQLFDHAVTEPAVADEAEGLADRVALIALGGYGRGELSPFSDLDLLLVHLRPDEDVEALASAMWYPLWDLGLRVGHAVRTTKEQSRLARRDLDSATALLTGRYLAGNRRLAEEVIADGRARWRRHGARWLEALQARVRDRQLEAGDVAYILEPDVKDGHGGLRDVQSLWWAEAAGLELIDRDRASLERCYGVLLTARVGLHRATGRAGEVLRLEDQDAVAATAGFDDADELMASVAAAARTIAWVGDETWGRIGRRRSRRVVEVSPGVVIADGEIELAGPLEGSRSDPILVLSCAVAAARHDRRIGRTTLDRLAASVEPWPGTWPRNATSQLVDLLRQGHRAIPVLEALDQRGLVSRLMPEWEPVRSKPQRNAYHRFTVDRHLWEAAANSAEYTDRVARPDLLVVGALFHDIGKGYQGDHTEVGMEIVAELAPRLGFDVDDTEFLVRLVQHHLLLPDVAVRRDLADDATITAVADEVRSVEFLEVLHALTEADSRATGPAAWNTWKAELVNELVTRVRHVLAGGDIADLTSHRFPDAATLAKMECGEADVMIDDDAVIVINHDRPGTFSRLAGVFPLYGLDVLNAQAHSLEAGPLARPMAASRFRVLVPDSGCNWDAVVPDLRRAIDGQLAIEARLADRARTYRRRRATQADRPGPPSLTFHDEASRRATVIEVRAPNELGVLYRITKALAEVGLDIRHATVQSIGMEVIDTFYVLTAGGELLTDPFHRQEVERAVLQALN